MVVLKQAANVKYGQFVEPGQTLIVSAEILSQSERETKLKANGKIDGQLTVSAGWCWSVTIWRSNFPAMARLTCR